MMLHEFIEGAMALTSVFFFFLIIIAMFGGPGARV